MRSCLIVLSLLPAGALAAAAGAAPLPEFAGRPAPRLSTPLIAEGRAPVILAPADGPGRAAAEALRAALSRRLGAEPLLAVRLADTTPGERTCIALGNMLDNELLTRLYFSRYTYEDALFPGGDGYTVHTVYDPYHWAGGRNVIVLGASRPEALRGAVDRFLGLVQGDGAAAELPFTLVVEPHPQGGETARAEPAGGAVEPSFTAFRTNAEQYLKTGDEARARLALAALDVMVGIYEKDPARAAPWPEETTSGEIFAAWDAFEECPLIPPDKRPAYLKAFFLWSRDLTRRSYEYRLIDENFTVTWNHTTFALLGLYYAGRYFERHFASAEAAEWVRRARLGFAAQARSWKPQEDADGYLVLTMRHVIDYSLAEWDLRFFETGLIRQYADYVVACGDNRQWPAGFGDSGYSAGPTMAAAALPIAFWWTRDGAYRQILESVTPRGWRNPYWQDVAPAPPERFVGLNVFPLDRQIYEDTQRRPAYSEAFARAEVPPEQAWDKISFRENWSPEGQYLLLDGLGRGKHLHFDTNSIVTFVQDGERWLLDHDYLVRNTTEHSMLSVLRDGRCGALVPSLAALEAAGETPAMAATRTTVRGYNGVDWARQIAWRKGRWFMVRDTVTAREAGQYDLDLTWKTIDRGSQAVDAEGRFTARRGSTYESSGLSLVDDAAAAGGKAVLLAEPSARLVFAVSLDSGDWELDVIGYGTDGSTDSVFVSLDGGPGVAVHLPQNGYGPSRSQFEQGSGTPKLSVARAGRHVVTVTLRENPPVRLDRIEFRRAGAEPVVVQAEAAPPVSADDIGGLPALALHIDPAGRPLSWVTNHVRQGISVPVSILHQRQSAALGAGESVAFCSLVHATGPAHPWEFSLSPLDGGAYRVTGPGGEAAAVVFGAGRAGAVQAEAEAWLLEGDSLHLVASRGVSLGDARISFEPPVDAGLDLSRGTMTVQSRGPFEVRAEGCRLRAGAQTPWQEAVSLPAGASTLLVDGLDARLLRQAPGAGAPAPRAAPAAAPAAEGLVPLWSLPLAPGKPVFRITPVDLDGDGREEVLAACGFAGHAVSGEGKLLWSHPTAGQVRDVSLARFARGAPGTVLISSADTCLYQLTPDGRETRRDQMTGIYFSADHGVKPWGVYCTRGVDTDGDGADDLLVTTLASMETQGLGPDGSKRWRRVSAYHGCMDMAAQDLDGDGTPEIVIANKYGSVYVLRPDGTVFLSSITSIGDVSFALGDLDGDGRTEIVHGSSTGDLVAVDLKGKVLWRFDNYGYPVERLLCTDLDGDGRPEILLASGTGYLYCLGPDGNPRWEKRLGLAVHDVAVAGGRLFAGTEEGLLHALDPSGEVVWTRAAGAAVLKLAPIRAGDAARVLVGLADGRLAAVAAE